MANGRGRPQSSSWQNQIPAGIWSDAAFRSLDLTQRLLLLRMIDMADRHGNGPVDGLEFRAAFRGLDVSEDDLEAMVPQLAAALEGSQLTLQLYAVQRNRYYRFREWPALQNLDPGDLPKTSKYPDPPPDHGHGPTQPPDGGGGGEPTVQPEPREAQTAPQEHGSADLPAQERQDTPREVPPSPEPLPDGYAVLARCHEQHCGMPLSSKDQYDLEKALLDARDAGVTVEQMRQVMRQAQAEYKPTRTTPRIHRIAYYVPRWDRLIRETRGDRPTKGKALSHLRELYDQALREETQT